MNILVIGATGFVGRKLVAALLERGQTVACMVRDPEGEGAEALRDMGCEIRPGDLSDPASLDAAVTGMEVIYYLAHLMADDDDAADLVSTEEGAARALAEAAQRAGVELVVYLGGLGDPKVSEHLRARARTAEVLRAEGPPLTYFRAAMIVGAGSESYLLLKSLVERLPAMIWPQWLENRTQPIDVDSLVEYLAKAPFVEDARGREIELGGPETMTYSEMLEGMGTALGETPPARLPTPAGIDAKAVGRLAGSLTRGTPLVAEHLTAGLATDTLVADPSGMALFEVESKPYDLALAIAMEEEFQAEDDRAVES